METKLLSLACNHCGASLDVPEGTRFLTCSYCSSKLQIERSGGAWYTSVLEQIQRNTEAVAGDLETIKLQNELEILDREWQKGRQSFMEFRSHGQLDEPSEYETIMIMFIVLPVIGAFLVAAGVVFGGANGLWFLASLGLLTVSGLLLRFGRNALFDDYWQARNGYETQRKILKEKIKLALAKAPHA